jgi:hypothetical protein
MSTTQKQYKTTESQRRANKKYYYKKFLVNEQMTNEEIQAVKQRVEKNRQNSLAYAQKQRDLITSLKNKLQDAQRLTQENTQQIIIQSIP